MLYETLSGFFSVNAAGQLTWIYKFCVACLVVLQGPFTDFDNFRKKEFIIAGCKWQIGQLTNVLNFLYDPTQNRITITQSISTPQFFWKFAYPPTMFLSDFGSAPMDFLEDFESGVAKSAVSINVPSSFNAAIVDDLIATVAQIALTGIPYVINFI